MGFGGWLFTTLLRGGGHNNVGAASSTRGDNDSGCVEDARTSSSSDSSKQGNGIAACLHKRRRRTTHTRTRQRSSSVVYYGHHHQHGHHHHRAGHQPQQRECRRRSRSHDPQIQRRQPQSQLKHDPTPLTHFDLGVDIPISPHVMSSAARDVIVVRCFAHAKLVTLRLPASLLEDEVFKRFGEVLGLKNRHSAHPAYLRFSDSINPRDRRSITVFRDAASALALRDHNSPVTMAAMVDTTSTTSLTTTTTTSLTTTSADDADGLVADGVAEVVSPLRFARDLCFDRRLVYTCDVFPSELLPRRCKAQRRSAMRT
eukprot:m.55554 g.55554  ORF g.55554 m.55554 type:complete len:314 (+) comp12538_c0_seq1:533-1474(+)